MSARTAKNQRNAFISDEANDLIATLCEMEGRGYKDFLVARMLDRAIDIHRVALKLGVLERGEQARLLKDFPNWHTPDDRAVSFNRELKIIFERDPDFISKYLAFKNQEHLEEVNREMGFTEDTGGTAKLVGLDSETGRMVEIDADEADEEREPTLSEIKALVMQSIHAGAAVERETKARLDAIEAHLGISTEAQVNETQNQKA